MFNRRVGIMSSLALGVAAAASFFSPTITIENPILAPAQGVERRRTISKKALARMSGDAIAIKKHRAGARPAKKDARNKSRKRARAKVRMRSHGGRS